MKKNTGSIYSCVAYCTAQEYNVVGLFSALEEGQESLQKIQSYHGVLHLHQGDDQAAGHLFVFPYGAVIFWGMDEAQQHHYLTLFRAFEKKSLEDPLKDAVTYRMHSKGETYISEEEDSIFIGGHDLLILLSLSYALSQSIKLIAFEDSALATIEATKHLPLELKKSGKTSLSRKKLAQELGALFMERSSINLRSDILDVPEFFWRRPRYENYYFKAYEYMDIGKRVDNLNRRLNVIHDLYEILSSELQHIHSSRLEIIIILLIVIEVVMELFHAFHTFF